MEPPKNITDNTSTGKPERDQVWDYPLDALREARQALIELSYQLNFRKKSLRELGEELGGISAGGLTHTHQRIQEKMHKDKKLTRRVNRIYQEIISQ